MKLRNKKTGEIISKIDVSQDQEGIWIMENKPRFYRTLAELNADWEDYKPAEPLIKDEKIRKAVRAWAEANCITQVSYEAGWNAFKRNDFRIEFDYDFDRHDGLNDNKTYTIAELCGEEEE